MMTIFSVAAMTAALASPAPSPSPEAPPAPIGRVTVATSSSRSLHRLALPAAALDPGQLLTANGAADDLLRTLPGIDLNRGNATFSAYGLNRISIGGAGEDRGALIVDGFPGQDGFGGQVDWAAIPARAIRSAEVLMGPGSALYGSGAIGGALALRTFGADDVGAASVTALDAGYSSLGDDLTLLAGAPLGQHWRVGAWASTSRTTFVALPPADRAPGTNGVATTVTDALRATARYAGGPFSLDLGVQNAGDAQQEGRTNYTFSRSQSQADVRASETFGEDALVLRVFDRASTIVNAADQFPKHPGELSYVQLVPDSDNGTSLDFTHASVHSDLLVRLETRAVTGYNSQASALGSLEDSGDGRQRYDAVALQDEVTSGKLQLLLGLRGDDINTHAESLSQGEADRTAGAISPRFALAELAGDFTFRAYAGGGLRVPFLNELVRSYRIGAIQYKSNLDLLPERSGAEGLGVDYAGGPYRVALDVQTTGVSDAITFRTIAKNLEMRSNVGKTRTDAATLLVSRNAGCNRYDLQMSDRDARITDDADPALIGKRLTYVPAQTASLTWTRTTQTQFDVRFEYFAQTYADDLNSTPLGTAGVLDVAYAIPAGNQSTLSLGASNATAARYLSSPDRQGPPSNLWLRLSLGPRPKPCAP
jgi:outer membrane receptor protein involved in Fe transport